MSNTIHGVDDVLDGTGVSILGGGTATLFGFSSDWELISRQVASADATLDFTWDETLYDEIEFSFYDIISDTDATGWLVRISDDDGVTFEAGASYTRSIRFQSGSTNSGSALTGATEFSMINSMGTGTNETVSGQLRLFNPGGATHKRLICEGVQVNSAAVHVSFTTTGWWAGSTNAINGMQFFMGSGNIASGTIVCRGRKIGETSLIGQDDWEVIEDRTGIAASATEDFFWTDGVYDEIEINAWGVEIGTDGQDMHGLVSTDGSTFLGGAADYKYTVNATNSAGTGNDHESGSATQILLGTNLGTAADEDMDFTVHLMNVANTTRKKKIRWQADGQLLDANLYRQDGTAIVMDSNASIQGFRFDGEGATTFSADRIRVRGRRVAVAGAAAAGGDFVHMGTFTGDGVGGADIEVDMRSSVNPQFADYQDVDFFVVIEGLIGASSAELQWFILQDGVKQNTAADYKNDGSTSDTNIRVSHATAGTGRRCCSNFTIHGINASAASRADLCGSNFTASSSGAIITDTIGGHTNGLAAGTNNGFVVAPHLGDSDDLVINVWAMARSAGAKP